MKVQLLVLSILMFLGCHSKENPKPNSPEKQDLNGTSWKMDYSMEIHGDTTYRHVPEHWVRIKTFTKNRFTFTGYDFGKKEIAGIGGGTYTLKDSIYTEYIEFHHRSDFNGTQFQGELYIDSLYLYQTGKVGELTLTERWHRID
ncbi:hypothetical protein [Flagellimonas flava]|uniref:Lipocalin-like domain-containing protein n=1 Tax=Flagellimonas flava TaxID=570519 RepID=A0A1M5N217_9FLAO|nr:hypothetical protein [Allomuricauda flava]SHG83604.1 hypothetical protein SAMN04488116_2617 [Allomuricauda flava]